MYIIVSDRCPFEWPCAQPPRGGHVPEKTTFYAHVFPALPRLSWCVLTQRITQCELFALSSTRVPPVVRQERVGLKQECYSLFKVEYMNPSDCQGRT